MVRARDGDPRHDDTPRVAVAAVSLEDKVGAVAGDGMWSTPGLEALAVERLRLSDGPNGVRGLVFDERAFARCTPCGSGLGATWDVALVHRVGELIGDEAVRQGVQVVLGPTLNLHRSPLGGRAFECFSEDPSLAGRLGAAWVRGLQDRGVAATPKHFVCNDGETSRTRVDCVVDERTLREMYLVPFEEAVSAGASALMTAYNKLNGVYCAANPWLVRQLLKEEWSFDGVVMTDWFAAGDTVGFARAGLDLEMPGPARLYGTALAAAVRAGTVDEGLVDDKLVRLARLSERVGLRRRGASSTVSPLAAGEADALLREAAAASFVLLKNEDSLLPLSHDGISTLAVIGPNATDPCFQGGGSAGVAMAAAPSPLEAIVERFGSACEVRYAKGCTARRSLPGLHRLDVTAPQTGMPGLQVEYFASDDEEPRQSEIRSAGKLIWLGELPGMDHDETRRVRVLARLRPAVTGNYTFSVRGSDNCGLSVAGRRLIDFAPTDQDLAAALFSEHEARGMITLQAGEDALVEVTLDASPKRFHLLAIGCQEPEPGDAMALAERLAADADVAVVVVGTTEDDERESADRDTTRLPGNQDELVRRVLAANPRTVVVVNAASAVDLPWADAAPAVLYTWFPGEAFGPALADVLDGTCEPGGRLPITLGERLEDYAVRSTIPDERGQLVYEESVFVGYRHFDANGIEPAFCFGHGLGYGTVSFEALEVSKGELYAGDEVEVRVRVRNTGDRATKEIVQCYVGDPEASVPRPPRELRAFAAVHLAPGEETTVTLRLDGRAFSFWEPSRSAWHAESGTFHVEVGRSSRDLPLRAELKLLSGDVEHSNPQL